MSWAGFQRRLRYAKSAPDARHSHFTVRRHSEGKPASRRPSPTEARSREGAGVVVYVVRIETRSRPRLVAPVPEAYVAFKRLPAGALGSNLPCHRKSPSFGSRLGLGGRIRRRSPGSRRVAPAPLEPPERAELHSGANVPGKSPVGNPTLKVSHERSFRRYGSFRSLTVSLPAVTLTTDTRRRKKR